jgi:hypothetical protein
MTKNIGKIIELFPEIYIWWTIMRHFTGKNIDWKVETMLLTMLSCRCSWIADQSIEICTKPKSSFEVQSSCSIRSQYELIYIYKYIYIHTYIFIKCRPPNLIQFDASFNYVQLSIYFGLSQLWCEGMTSDQLPWMMTKKICSTGEDFHGLLKMYCMS